MLDDPLERLERRLFFVGTKDARFNPLCYIEKSPSRFADRLTHPINVEPFDQSPPWSIGLAFDQQRIR